MISYIIRRLLLMVPTLLGITLLVFMVMAMAPGGIAAVLMDEMGGQLQTEEARRVAEYYERRYGLDRPVIVQYARWLNQIAPMGFEVMADGSLGDWRWIKMPDLGTSLIRHRPVVDLIAESLPITLLLNLITIPLIYTIGILSGIIAAKYRGHTFDVASSGVYLGLWSVPVIWAGVMLIGLFANEQYIRLFPTAGIQSLGAERMLFLPAWDENGFQRGYLLDLLWHLVLPIICLSYAGFAFLSKLTRSSILENLNADYVRTARAKGVGERDVLFRHVFRNSMLSLITVAASILPALLAGSVVVEKIFTIPGMGRLGVDAVMARDREVVLAVTFIGGLVGLTAELIRDICYAIADPRVSYE
jgi:ABC-type dipeptide/oligopeptide/nickel transport system permease component